MKKKLVKYLALVACTLALMAQREEEPIQEERLRLIFAGDIMVHAAQLKAAQNPADTNTYSFHKSFEYVRPLLQSADLAIGNLELTMPGELPYQGYPLFRCPEELSAALRVAGFDLMMTANNHCNDSAAPGVLNTIDVLNETGFYHTGTFQSREEKEAYYPLIVYKKGFKLAFLNYTYDTNGIPTRVPSMVNEIDSVAISEDMRAAREMQPDAIIVMLHWGSEYHLKENRAQEKLAAQLLREGADLIVGAHPHVVQPAKWLKNTTTGKPALVAYSLGNFISGQMKPHTDGGILLEVELLKKAGHTTLEEAAFAPLWRHIEYPPSGKRIYRVLPIAAFEQQDFENIRFTDSDREAMQRYASQTRPRVGLPELPIDFDFLTQVPQ